LKKFIFLLLILGVIVGGSIYFTMSQEGEVVTGDVAQLTELRDELTNKAQAWVQDEALLARTNGNIYTVDMAQLAIAAAMMGDEALYTICRDWLVARVVVRNLSDPLSHGMVAWRAPLDPEEPLDASGTTEALRTAEALFLGSQAFESHDDMSLVLEIMKAYSRHEGVDQNIWLIRNYFNLGTRAFATNTYLVDYDVDFTWMCAKWFDDPELIEVAKLCEKTVIGAVGKTGLVYPMIQPEILTLTPEGRATFAPNRIVQLSNSLTVLERLAETSPEHTKAGLRFAIDRLTGKRLHFDIKTGDPIGHNRPGVETYAPMLRLALKLDDRASAEKVLPYLMDAIDRQSFENPDARLYLVGEALMALQMYLDQS